MAQLTYWSLQYYDHVPTVRAGRKALCKQMTALMLSQWRTHRWEGLSALAALCPLLYPDCLWRVDIYLALNPPVITVQPSSQSTRHHSPPVTCAHSLPAPRHICENFSPHKTADDHAGDCSGTKFYHWGALTGMITLIEDGFY